jgi:hypothetical protein
MGWMLYLERILDTTLSIQMILIMVFLRYVMVLEIEERTSDGEMEEIPYKYIWKMQILLLLHDDLMLHLHQEGIW